MKKSTTLPNPMSASQFAALCGVQKSRVSKWIASGLPTIEQTSSGREAKIELSRALPWVAARSSLVRNDPDQRL